MFLTTSSMAHYLLARGLLPADAVVDGPFAVIEAERRNRNFKVETGPARGFFVKQPRSTGPDVVMTSLREAAFYELLVRRPAFAPIARAAPRFVHYDGATHTLIVELLAGYENLTEHHLRLERYPEEAAAAVGRAIGGYHAASARLLTEPVDVAIMPRQVPWLFGQDPRAPFPPEAFGMTGVQMTLLLGQFPGLFERAVAVAKDWRFDSVVHGDMKWDNLLVPIAPDDARPARIIDWELVDFGDAAWEVASVVVGYLHYWAWSSTPRPGQTIGDVGEASQAAFEALRPATRAFFDAYAAARGLGASERRAFAERSVRLCAPRAMQALFEQLFNRPHIDFTVLTLAFAIQSMIGDVHAAVRDFFGA